MRESLLQGLQERWPICGEADVYCTGISCAMLDRYATLCSQASEAEKDVDEADSTGRVERATGSFHK